MAEAGLGSRATAGRRSSELFAEACRVIPGGVDSPVRAFGAVGGAPYFVASAKGAYLEDVDGRRDVPLVSPGFFPPGNCFRLNAGHRLLCHRRHLLYPATFTWICFGFAASALGIVTTSNPFR